MRPLFLNCSAAMAAAAAAAAAADASCCRAPTERSAFTKVHGPTYMPSVAAAAAAAAAAAQQYVPCGIPPGAELTSGGLVTGGVGYPSPGPAALALVSSLLPPTLSALALPAQNVCAKCNISFRMTSDLVYHMRSHHKAEGATEAYRRRREADKLRCPVCAETFRERHHLTRHMTAHQDKEGDDDTPEPSARKRAYLK